jgi:hypothetical protein
MKPYTLTITSAESRKVSYALNKGLWAAKELVKQGSIGADQMVRALEEAIAIMNKPHDGGYENDAELSAASLEKFAAECVLHGCD